MLCTPNRFTWRLLGWALLSALLALAGALARRWNLEGGALRGILAVLPVLPMVVTSLRLGAGFGASMRCSA
jgi:hypothetical protein